MARSDSDTIVNFAEKHTVPEQSGASNDRGIIDIDSNSKCLQSCSIYAPDIYDRIRVTEVCFKELLFTICHSYISQVNADAVSILGHWPQLNMPYSRTL